MRLVLRCPVDGRGFEVGLSPLASSREVAMAMVEKFGQSHEECAWGADLPEASRPHRCGVCGARLLFGVRCPVHPGSHRVEWTRQLARAYEAVAEARSAGTVPVAPLPEADAYSQALRLFERWGRAA